MLQNLMLGFSALASLKAITSLMVGILLGYTVGCIPGISASIGIALLLPFTFGMEPVPALCMLVAVYMASEYGGAIPAILVNVPGVPGAAAAAFDGYPMTQRGEAGKALTLSILGSGAGSFLSTIFLILTAQVMADVALAFGPAEYFALAVLGLSLIVTLSTGSLLKAMIGLLFGLVLTAIGVDPLTGDNRYVVVRGLLDGIPFVPALIGLFALAEVFFMLEIANQPQPKMPTKLSLWSSLGVLNPHWGNVFRSSVIGYIIGVIPGAGAAIASFAAYACEKRLNKGPIPFGEGNPDGVVASETANNAVVCGALAPMLALGVPGSASAAILIGGLMIHGLQPGPLLFTNSPQVPYSIFASLLIGLPIMVVLGLAGARLWVLVTLIPRGVVATMVGALCLTGAYASDNDEFSVAVAVAFGVIGYLLRKVDIQPAPIVLALVLGEMMEINLRRGLISGNNSLMFFLSSPISGSLLVVAALLLFVSLFTRKRAVA
ncbi:MAG: hypothetical protein GEU95_18455 [Rhizobiales bacterium]|nr:hypothetical protein [Hyphomicrobiales bacterium]